MLDKKYSCDSFTVKVTSNKKNNKNCGAGYALIDIKPNLDVTLCPTTMLKLGNLREQSIHEIMERHGDSFNSFISPCAKFCKDCIKRNICKGCIAQGLVWKDKVSKCPWYEAQNGILQTSCFS
jgi:radical SAM protein with 4Fe4S-binding SPASM domain